MIRLDNEFTHKGVTFKIIKRGKKAVILDAKADFYTCESVEVWQIRHSKDSTIKGSFIAAREIKPGNENYPYTAHQFMRNHFKSDEEFMDAALKRFNEYENGIRPKKIVNIATDGLCGCDKEVCKRIEGACKNLAYR